MKSKIKNQNQSWIRSTKLPTLHTARLCLSVLALIALAAGPSLAQTYTILHHFGTNVMGMYPSGPLVQGPDGTLYGATESGGVFNRGQVFKVAPDGSGYTILHDFGAMDDYSEGGLVVSGATLYGVTDHTVFILQTDGTGFAVLKEFAEEDGVALHTGLVLSSSTLYGTAAFGGAYGQGTVFKLQTDGSGFQVLKNFGPDDGMEPEGRLLVLGTTLYGTTVGGGSNDVGVVFRVNVDGSDYQVLHHFSALAWGEVGNTNADGAWPRGGLVQSGTTLYGTATACGTNGGGTLFKLSTDGTGFTVLKHFGGGGGSGPHSDLLLSGSTLYGTTWEGGGSGLGTVFKLQKNGSGFEVLREFSDSDGMYPWGGLVLSGTTLYGAAGNGGPHNYGTLFTLQTDGSGFAVIMHFVGDDGREPSGALSLSGAMLYGTAQGGGSSDNGILYRIHTNGSGYQMLKDFTNALDGVRPTGGLLLSGTTCFGTAMRGSPNNDDGGTVFKMNTDGSGFTVLHTCSPRTMGTNADGALPKGGLVLSGATLYGAMREGGPTANGTLFKIQTDGTGFIVLKHFNGPDGAYPNGELVLEGDTLFGTSEYGGSGAFGTVFKVNTDGTGFQTLKYFEGDRRSPQAGLLLSGNTLYGTTYDDSGSPLQGAIFKIHTDGSGFTILKEFNGSDGRLPGGRLSLTGTSLLGTTPLGGAFDSGVLFKIETDGSGFAILKHFQPTDGTGLSGPVWLSGLDIYGVARGGGSAEGGVLFRYSLAPPTIVPASQSAEIGAAVEFFVGESKFVALPYHWFFNGTDLHATGESLQLTNVQPGQSGAYTFVATQSSGSFTSAPAMLMVIPPVERRMVPGVVLSANTGSTLNLEYRDVLSMPTIWLPLATTSVTSPSQYYFDLTMPLPPQRFYRAWQDNPPGARLSLGLHMIPALPLTGGVSSQVRVDGINQFGPIDAWFTLDTVTLTNTSQLYFDVSVIGQPLRLYRLVQVP